MISLEELQGEDLQTIKVALEEQRGYSFDEVKENCTSLFTEEELEDSLWELASDLGVPDALLCYFDRERFARESKMDYQTLEIDGTTYYFRVW